MSNLVIGIEGLVGAGKTSICRKLIKIMPNTVLVNGGNIYRAIVYSMIKNGSKLEELKKQGQKLDIKEMMDLLKIQIKIEENETILYIDNEKIDEDSIQSKEASIAVSSVAGGADNRKLFEFAKNLINNLKQNYNVIVSGRSVMKIYPECDYHFFVVADLDERVRRKCIQYNVALDSEEGQKIRENVITRDDLQEKSGYYKLYDNTIVIDVTEAASVLESCDMVIKEIKELN